MRIRSIALVLAFLFSPHLPAEDFTSQAAKDAKAAYDADLKAARNKYRTALTEAAKAAADAGDVDELNRITAAIEHTDDALQRGRQKIAGCTYTFSRPGRPDFRMTFRSNGKVKRVLQGESNEDWGIWTMLEERTLIYRNLSPPAGRHGSHFLLSFDEKYQTAIMLRLVQGENFVESVRLTGRPRVDHDQPDTTPSDKRR